MLKPLQCYNLGRAPTHLALSDTQALAVTHGNQVIETFHDRSILCERYDEVFISSFYNQSRDISVNRFIKEVSCYRVNNANLNAD